MGDLPDLIEGLERLIEIMFGNSPPDWLLPAIAWIIFGCAALAGGVFILEKLKKIWVEFLKPLFHKPAQKRLAHHRQQFADHLEGEIRRLNRLEGV